MATTTKHEEAAMSETELIVFLNGLVWFALIGGIFIGLDLHRFF